MTTTITDLPLVIMMEVAEFVGSSVHFYRNTQHHKPYNSNLVDLALWVTVNSFKGESNELYLRTNS
jgi:hypothetical protein